MPTRRKIQPFVSLIWILVFLLGIAPVSLCAEQATLAAPLRRADSGVELHFFYVHGIGINPPEFKHHPQNFESSLEFRTNFCSKKWLRCTTKAGEWLGRNYADKHLFKLNQRPHLFYFEDPVWKTNEEWNAAAPFVDHYKLERKNGTTIYLHEINWWPLVLAAKCREIVATDSALVDPDKKHTAVCSANTVADGDRYKSFAWIQPQGIGKRISPWPKGTAFNRWLKHDVMDWSFADAVLAIGPLHDYLLEAIRELVLASFTPKANQEFVIVSHSLGSYLMFSALDFQGETTSKLSVDHRPAPAGSYETELSESTIQDWKSRFDDVLKKTSQAYFMANQLRLLELADLTSDHELTMHLARWGQLRKPKTPEIFAFSDPDDLLTWQIPDMKDVSVTNVPVRNTCWHFAFANPLNAHIFYDKNKKVLHAMLPKESAVRKKPQSSTM